MMRAKFKFVTVLVVTSYLLTSCSNPNTESATNESIKVSTATIGDCVNNKFGNFSTRDSGSVLCEDGKYTGKTIQVFEVPDDLKTNFREMILLITSSSQESIGTEDAPQIEKSAEFLAVTNLKCNEKIRQELSLAPYRASNFFGAVTIPSEIDWDNGQNWIRCSMYFIGKSENVYKFADFPEDFKSNGSLYENQYCVIFDDVNPIAGSCSLPELTENSWMKIASDVPFYELGTFPGSPELIRSQVQEKCQELSSDYLKMEINFDTDTYWDYTFAEYSGLTLTLEDFQSEIWEKYWDSSTSHFDCYIPNWAYTLSP